MKCLCLVVLVSIYFFGTKVALGAAETTLREKGSETRQGNKDSRSANRDDRRSSGEPEQEPIEAEDFDNSSTKFIDTQNLPEDNSMVSQYFYVGAWMGALRAPPSMDAISPVFFVSPYWGSDWNEDFSFEGAIYSYTFYEDLYKRPNHSGDPNWIYKELGIKLRYLQYISDNRYMRLRPLFEMDDIVLPYFAVGLQIEPNIKIKDPKPELIAFYDTSWWGAGINLGFGGLHIFRNTSFRMRYEVGMDNNYNPMKNSDVIKSIWTEFYLSLGMEYSFSLKGDYKQVNPEIYSSFDAYAPNQFDKESQEKQATDQAVLDIVSKEYALDSKVVSKQNLLKKNNYSIIFDSKKVDLNKNMIDKVQKITFQYRKDREYNRIYKIYAVAPKEPPPPENEGDKKKEKKQADEAINLARKRAILLNDLMVNADIPQSNVVYSWKVIENNSENDLYGSNDYAIIEEYIFENMPEVEINKSLELAQQEASIIAEREAQIRKAPQNPNDSTIIDNTVSTKVAVQDIEKTAQEREEKSKEEQQAKQEVEQAAKSSRWVLPEDNLKQGDTANLSQGTKVKTENYQSSSEIEQNMKPSAPNSVQSLEDHDNPVAAPEVLEGSVGSGTYFKSPNAPAPQEIKGQYKYEGEKSFLLTIDKKSGTYDKTTATQALESFLMLQKEGYKLYIEYWFSNNQASKLESNMVLYTEVNKIIEQAIKKGASEDDIIVAGVQTIDLNKLSKNGSVYVVRLVVSK